MLATPIMVAKNTANTACLQSRGIVRVCVSINPKTSPRAPEPFPVTETVRSPDSRRRHVRFDELPQIHYFEEVLASSMSDELKAVIWYQQHDYEYFKHNANGMARSVRERHRADPVNPRSYSNVLAQTYTACVRKVEPPVTALAKWFAMGCTQRGLEMLCVKSVKDERRYHSGEAIRAIVEEYRRGRVGDGLRTFSEERTQPAKRFASALAQADFLCLQSDAQFKDIADIYPEKNTGSSNASSLSTLPLPLTNKKIITQRKSPQIPYGAKRA